MKILLSFVLIFVFVFQSFAAPLVYKVTKQIKNPEATEFVELATFDASKYKQIRVAVRAEKSDFSKLGNTIWIEGVEAEDSFIIESFVVNDLRRSGSVLLYTFPAKIKISVRESGTYKISVWGE